MQDSRCGLISAKDRGRVKGHDIVMLSVICFAPEVPSAMPYEVAWSQGMLGILLSPSGETTTFSCLFEEFALAGWLSPLPLRYTNYHLYLQHNPDMVFGFHLCFYHSVFCSRTIYGCIYYAILHQSHKRLDYLLHWLNTKWGKETADTTFLRKPNF